MSPEVRSREKMRREKTQREFFSMLNGPAGTRINQEVEERGRRREREWEIVKHKR